MNAFEMLWPTASNKMLFRVIELFTANKVLTDILKGGKKVYFF